MNTTSQSEFRHFWVGLGLGAIGGFVSALLARKESRDYLRERSAKSLEYLSAGGKKLREGAEGIAQKGREFITQRCSQCGGATARSTTENGKQEESAEP